MRCGDPAHWECAYTLFGGIWCRCVVDISENGSWRKEENATSVEVLSEIQPGNNETLVSLFEMECEEKSEVREAGGLFVDVMSTNAKAQKMQEIAI